MRRLHTNVSSTKARKMKPAQVGAQG
jgi:hypothetical protein